MGPDGKPNFNLLQNFKSPESHITYYAFDVLMHKGRDGAGFLRFSESAR
jgi:ATP-dependent DNA ligase